MNITLMIEEKTNKYFNGVLNFFFVTCKNLKAIII